MRFHCGISFSWRSIKKFLFPILIGLLAYFGFSFIYDNNTPLGFLNVYAYVNTDTTYNVDIPNYDERLEQNYVCNGVNLKDYIQFIIDSVDWTTSKYDLLIPDVPIANSTMWYYLLQKNNTEISNNYNYYYTMWVRGGVLNNFQNQYGWSPRYWTMTPTGAFYYMACNSSTDVYTDGFTLSLINYIQNGSLINNVSSSPVGYISIGGSTQVSRSENLGSTISNNTSYNVSLWWYYSSSKYVYYQQDYTTSSYYYKKVCLVNEDKCYLPGDTFDSYYDLHHHDTPDTPTFIGYQDDIKTLYTSLSPSSVNNYQLKYKFNVPQSLLGYYQTPQEYIDNTSFDFVCGGRVDNTNYYSYDTFNCSLTTSYTNNDNSIEYTFSNLLLDHSITSYDKIYITIKSKHFDSNISTTIFNASYTYSLGSFYNTDYKGAIYESFSNLPLNFRVYLSSNSNLNDSLLYVEKYNFIDYGIKYIGFSNSTNQQNLVIGSSILGNTGVDEDFISTNVSNSIDTGIMIYQDNSAIVLPSLNLFFNSGIVISLNNSSNNDFYYVDSDGNIQHNILTIPIIESSNDYDISYYVSSITNFIDDKRDTILQLSSLTQIFYNDLPLPAQTFLFVVFVFFCLLFIYLLIKRR